MSSQTIKLVEMMYYKKKKIELKLTDLHKFLNLSVHWQTSFKIDGGRLYRFTDHISNCPSQKKIELNSINLRKKHKSVSHPKNGSKSLRAKWLTNYNFGVLCR